jgi:2Fe-2S ferredoxin
MKSKVAELTFLPFKKTVSFTGHPSILEVALANEIPLNHSCGGMGSCTTCLVLVKKGLDKLNSRTELEQEHANSRSFQDHERLACQTSAADGLVVVVPEDSQGTGCRTGLIQPEWRLKKST